MTKKIVIGVDGSEPARAALRWGVGYAQRAKTEVELFYVIDLTPFSDTPVFESEALTEGQKLLDQEVAYAKSVAPDVTYTTNLAPGTPTAVFEEESKGAELMVVGTHKGSKLPNVIFGSKPIRLAASAHSPVAVVPTYDLGERHGVYVAVDGSPTGNVALEYAARAADSLGETLHIISAWTIPAMPATDVAWSAQIIEEVRNESRAVLQGAKDLVSGMLPDLKIETQLIEAEPVRGIVEAAKHAALLVVGNRGRKGLTRLFLGSVSHGVLNNIPSPVIIVRADENLEK
ncbi:universal stress protein [Pseudoclavibacter sp. CFCC 14310]|uniref:universal stress protein n=1 Tax=Pseudoclavibacter sp. CFCC 14310 TaxID=2615180 RepID=UPI0013017C23|nr:universal stress protein [Pseudoclavibacter sp. CFCC 14310]KAB1647162.1 universal stress protein [Pseudoclavibacter sp. CFCC 14310]